MPAGPHRLTREMAKVNNAEGSGLLTGMDRPGEAPFLEVVMPELNLKG